MDLDNFWLQKVNFAFRRFQKVSEGRCIHVLIKILEFTLRHFIVHVSHFNDAWYAEATTHAFHISHFFNAYFSQTKVKSLFLDDSKHVVLNNTPTNTILLLIR